MPTVRPPAVAGMFYPAEPARLASEVDAMVAAAGATAHEVPPKALIVPHAGYVYSGPVAASAYARIAAGRKTIRQVVLLGPVHRVPVRGLALPGVEAFDTPLGRVPLDLPTCARLLELPQVIESPAAHRLEHSLEVHLPFLQRLLEHFAVVPLAVGDATAEEVAQVLNLVWGGDETLIVISSDLSHYLPYQQARTRDAETAAMITTLRTDIEHEQACGGTPVNGLALIAQRRGLAIEMVDLRNSGDTAGGRERVVGYGAFVAAPRHELAHDAGTTLIGIARSAIGEKLGGPTAARKAAPWPARPGATSWLERPGATFVTLMCGHALRGCIGSLQASRALALDVHENALGAAFRDPRFKPLSAQEWAGTSIEIALLSALEPLPLDDEAEVLRRLRPGVDGLVLEFGHHRGTFLPQVWEQLPEPESFLINLKRKAGLPPDFWEPGMRLKRYTVTKWREQDLV